MEIEKHLINNKNQHLATKIQDLKHFAIVFVQLLT